MKKNLEIVPGTMYNTRPHYPIEIHTEIDSWTFTREEINHRKEQLLEEAESRRLKGRSQYAMFSQYLGTQYPKSRKDALNRLAILSCGRLELRRDKPPKAWFDGLQISWSKNDWSLAIDADPRPEGDLFVARYDIDTLYCNEREPFKYKKIRR